MEQTKWAAPVTYGASKFEVMTDELHARHVAVVNTFDDAKLIASAPDLLAALELMVAKFGYSQPGYWSDEEKTARAAIAKAKGE